MHPAKRHKSAVACNALNALLPFCTLANCSSYPTTTKVQKGKGAWMRLQEPAL
jgi:hypothetical protein